MVRIQGQTDALKETTPIRAGGGGANADPHSPAPDPSLELKPFRRNEVSVKTWVGTGRAGVWKTSFMFSENDSILNVFEQGIIQTRN